MKLQGFPIPDDVETLFPAALSDNGNYVFWRMQADDPNLWTVTVNEPRGDRWDFFDGSLTEFLAAVLSGRNKVSVFPGDLLDEPVVFSAY